MLDGANDLSDSADNDGREELQCGQLKVLEVSAASDLPV